MARALARSVGIIGWLSIAAGPGCSTPTNLSQTTEGVTRTFPGGGVLNLPPETVQGESVVDVPSVPGQPSLRIVTGTVKLELAARSTSVIMGPPDWAEIIVRFPLTGRARIPGALESSNAIVYPLSFDAPGMADSNSRIGFAVSGAVVEQTPSGELNVSARVAVRGLGTTSLLRIGYQANLVWRSAPGAAAAAPAPAASTGPAPAVAAPPPPPVLPPATAAPVAPPPAIVTPVAPPPPPDPMGPVPALPPAR